MMQIYFYDTELEDEKKKNPLLFYAPEIWGLLAMCHNLAHPGLTERVTSKQRPEGGEETSHADSGHLNTTQRDSWASENFWLDPSVNGQPETKAEDEELRKSLDRFYEMFGHPPPTSRNPLSASVCQCLSQKIDELQGQESQKYALRSFQMARVIFNRDGCSLLQRYSRDARFYPLGEGSQSLDDEKPTPGLSKDIVRFLLQQNVMGDP